LNPASYPYSWALERAQDLYRAHPRATETVLELLDISLKQLALFLAKRDPVWVDIRDAIHLAENWIRNRGCTTQTFRVEGIFALELRRKGKERLADRLDAVQKRHIIEEQGSRERTGAR
jgi:hypothetical protein